MLVVLPGFFTCEDLYAQAKWKNYQTDYLTLKVPASWEIKPGTQKRVRFNAPKGLFKATVFIGAYSNSSIDSYKNNYAYEFEEIELNGTLWLKDERIAEGTTEVTLVTPYQSGIIQVIINYDYDERDKYKETAESIICSLHIPDAQ